MYYKLNKADSDKVEAMINAGYSFPVNAFTTRYTDVIRDFPDFDYLLRDSITEQYEEQINFIEIVEKLPELNIQEHDNTNDSG